MGEKVRHDDVSRAAEGDFAVRSREPIAATRQLTPQSVLALQQTAGNAAVQRAVLARQPEKDYEEAVKNADWPLAAQHLNGLNREAILERLKKRTVAEVRLLHQGAVANKAVGPQSQLALLTPDLLSDFADKFRTSAETIRLSPEAMKLVSDADAAKVKFGGFAEDGPGKTAWPYTIGDTVYVPKAHTDAVVAMSDFLFELNNAIRQPAFAEIFKKAGAGSIDAKQYARDIVTQEVDGMLRLGKVWFETKKAMGGAAALDKYDLENYQVEYKAFLKGTKSKDDIITDVLGRKYTEGAKAGKTVEQNYMEQYETSFGKKKAEK